MHLSDSQLHEYLDRALAPGMHEAAVRHLAACVECARRLTALQSLFDEIGSLPEQTLSRSLAEPVRRGLRQRAGASVRDQARSGRAALPRWLRLTAVLEAALAVVTLALAAPLLSEFAASIAPAAQIPSMAELSVQLQGQWMALLLSIPEFAPPEIPSLSADVSSLALTAIAAGAFLLWVIGNGVLLRRVLRRTS